MHTVIRPIGGAFLAIRVLGHSSPTFDVLIVLLAGGTSLIAHTAKASSRLAANASPEPFSNIGVSLVEDVARLRRPGLDLLQPAHRAGHFRFRDGRVPLFRAENSARDEGENLARFSKN